MSFLNPWAITIGAVALATPLVVHFLTRPRPRPMPLSTIQLVFEAIKQRRSRHRLRDFLVLLLRMLAIALIALAIARPQWQNSVIQASNSDVDVARVIILDISQSMEAGRGGNQPMERARAVADRYLQPQQGLVAGLVLVGARAESVFDQLSGNLAALRQTVRTITTRPQAADAFGAINLAAEMLAKTDPSMKREVILISDFQRADWGAIRFDALAEDTAVQMESVALAGSNNLAVLAIRHSVRVVVDEPFTCEVEVGNFSEIEQPIRCSLRLGQTTRTVQQTLPPGQSMITFPLEVGEPGWLTGSVQFLTAADDLPSDDVRPWVLKVATKPKVVLLSGQNAQLRPSAGYYLERAITYLVADAANSSSLVRMSPRSIDQSTLDAADVVVLDHPGRLSTGLVKNLADALRRGRGIFYVVSELADGVNLQAIQQQLGAMMQLPVRFVPPAGRRARRGLSVFEVARREPPFAVFGDALDSAFAGVRIGGGLGTEQTEQSLKDRILAKLSDQSAMLVMTDAGDGKIAVLNADLDQSNLAVQAPFVPLLGELIGNLLARSSAETEADCGQPLVRLMPPSVDLEDQLTVRPVGDWPESPEGYGSWEASPTGVLWQWPRPDQVGAYRVQRAGETMLAVAVTTPASESDLSTLDAGVIDNTTSSARPLGFRDARDAADDKDRWWNWLLVACVLGLVSEVVALRLFRT